MVAGVIVSVGPTCSDCRIVRAWGKELTIALGDVWRLYQGSQQRDGEREAIRRIEVELLWEEGGGDEGES